MRIIRFIAPVLIIFLLLTAGALILFPEQFIPVRDNGTSTPASDETLGGSGIGEPTALDGASIVIERVLEDSRCPRGVECIRAGTVRVFATLTDDGRTATGTLELGTPRTLGDFHITLTSVSPDPVPGFPITSYRFALVGERVKPSGGEATTTAEIATRTEPTGIRGLILLTPTCPVERENDPCPPLPASNIELRAIDMEGNEVARTKSGADGRFLILLPPGVYVIERTDSSPIPSFAPVQASVPETGFRDVLIEADSGIR